MAENAALKVVLAAARRAVTSWVEPGMPGHRQAMEVLGRALIALYEQGEDGSG